MFLSPLIYLWVVLTVTALKEEVTNMAVPTSRPTAQTLSPTAASQNTNFFYSLHADRECALPAYGIEVPLATRRIPLNTCLPAGRVEGNSPFAPTGSSVGGDGGSAAVMSATPHIRMRCRVMENKYSLDYARYDTRALCLAGGGGSVGTRVMWRHEYVCMWDQSMRGGSGAYRRVHCGEPLPTSNVQVTSAVTYPRSSCTASSLDAPAAPVAHWLDACTPKHASAYSVRMNTTKGPDPNHDPVEYQYTLTLLQPPGTTQRPGGGDWMQLVRRRYLRSDRNCSRRVIRSRVVRYPAVNDTLRAACLADPLQTGRYYLNAAGGVPFLEGGMYRPTSSPTGQPSGSPTSRPSKMPTPLPSPIPSPRPSPSPTPAPTHAPSGNPSPRPSPSPTAPTASPTLVPTTILSTYTIFRASGVFTPAFTGSYDVLVVAGGGGGGSGHAGGGGAGGVVALSAVSLTAGTAYTVTVGAGGAGGSGSAAPTTGSYSCAPYSASDTNSATQNYVECAFRACGGSVLSMSNCGCSGDTYYRLFSPAGYEVVFNDDSCGVCSTIYYTVPGGASECGVYSLRQGCYSTQTCSGQTVVEGGASAPTAPRGTNGGNSQFGSWAAAIGGGGGGTYCNGAFSCGTGLVGGSGGGGGADIPSNTYAGAAGTAGQGYAGADGCLDTVTGAAGNGGGGGGAGGGGNAASCGSTLTAGSGYGGAGGAAVSTFQIPGALSWGVDPSFSALGVGVSGYIAGGGGGGAWATCCSNPAAGRAVGGGGGAGYGECCGAPAYGSMQGQAATANTGSGGGGGPDYNNGGGAGGSGFVVIRITP